MRMRHSRYSEQGKIGSRRYHPSYSKIKEHVVQCGRNAKAKIHRISKSKTKDNLFVKKNENNQSFKSRFSLHAKLKKGGSIRNKSKFGDAIVGINYDKDVSTSTKENCYYDRYKNSFEDERYKMISPLGSADSSFQQLKQVCLVKNNSLQSLKNMIKMGYEAESSGTHALDVLHCQHDVLRDVDNKLDRMQAYNKRASDNIMHLRGLKPTNNMTPTFNEFENVSANALDIKDIPLKSEKRLTNYANQKNDFGDSSLPDFLNYTPRRYDVKFEFRSPEDDIDCYINKALDEVGNISRKLRYIAQETSDELDCQLNRLSYTEDSMQRVGGKLGTNSNKLESIIGKSSYF